MIFKATEQQVRQIMANAVNASNGVGMGFLNYETKNYTTKDIRIDEGAVSADYFYGRMVKLKFELTAVSDHWRVARPMYTPNPGYQSWVKIYPTLHALVTSVPGVEIIKE